MVARRGCNNPRGPALPRVWPAGAKAAWEEMRAEREREGLREGGCGIGGSGQGTTHAYVKQIGSLAVTSLSGCQDLIADAAGKQRGVRA